MKYRLSAVFFVLSIFLFSGCASILNSSHQEVTIRTHSPDAKVYVDDELVGQGDSVTTEVERDFEVKQIKVEREGYKPEYVINGQYKRSPLYTLSWIPFGILFYPPYYDNGPKAFDYYDQVEVQPEMKIQERSDDKKYIYLSSTAFHIDKKDLVIRENTIRRHKKNKEAYSSEHSDEKLEMDNSVFTQAINQVLKDYGYIDTTQTIFKDKTNTLRMRADVKQVTFEEIKGNSVWFGLPVPGRFFLTTEVVVNWKIHDIYDQLKFEKKVSACSGQFSEDFYSKEEVMFKSLEDAVARSFFSFLQEPELEAYTEIDAYQIPEFEVDTLAEPAHPIRSISEAQAATVTLITDEGHGSGCVIGAEGTVLTNYHVVAGSESIQLKTHDGEKIEAELIRKNEFSDLALLKTDQEFKESYILPVEKAYEVGQEVYAIGTPTSPELGQTLNKGIVSGVREKKHKTWIQTDVSVNPGSSGGALVNKNGELIGLVNSKVMGLGIEGLSFCIPAEKIKKLISVDYTD